MTTFSFMTTASRLGRPLALLVLLGACTGPDPTPPAETITLGSSVQQGVCDDVTDCPPGYECVNLTCASIDRDIDNDGFEATVDCDDQDRTVNPDQPEVCNGRDDNCNGATDEGVLNACGTCGPEPAEVCDLEDNDCDGIIDDGCVAGSVPESEPNDGQLRCQQIALPPAQGDTATLAGAFSPAGDVDSYCFTITPGSVLRFDLDSQILGAPSDAVIALFDSDGVQLPGGFNDYAGGPDPLLEYTFAAGGEVRLDVYNFDAARGGTDYVYQLKVTAVTLRACDDLDGDGVSVCDGDCNDDDVQIFPGQTEVCDGSDNDCNGGTDEGCPDLTRVEMEPNDTIPTCELLTLPFTVGGLIDPRKDKDTWCFFAPTGAVVAFDVDAREPPGTSLLNSRLRLYVLPDVQIAANDDGIDPDTGYTAADSDSFLEHTFDRPAFYAIQISDESLTAGGQRLTYKLHATVRQMPPCTDTDGDGVSVCEGDCRDGDAAVHFGAVEICDGKDNDCDGLGDPSTCIGDFDGDGFAGEDGDCDDTDPLRYPGATETCNDLDDNCDGDADEGVRNACGGCAFAPAERCGDSVDNDCDGVTDTDCTGDADGDTFTPDQGDCDDGNGAIKPGAAEICDGVDNDCDGLIDEFVKNSCGECGPERAELCDGIDNNCNGLIDDGALNLCGTCGPAPLETCDSFDNDCDGSTDEGLANACGDCGPLPAEVCDNVDNNCDGTTDERCDDDTDNDLHTPREGDCDDSDPEVYAGAPEVCGDTKDNNCNGRVNEPAVCPIAAETEANDVQAQCDTLLWPGVIQGLIPAAGDVDHFCFTVPAGVKLGFDIDAQDDGSPLDAFVEILTPDGTRVSANDSGLDPDTSTFSLDPYLVFEVTTPGTYAIAVKASGTGATAGATASYKLFVEVVEGCLDLDRDGITSCAGDCNDEDAATNPGAVDICDTIDNNCAGGADERCVGTCLDDLLEQNDTPAAAKLVPASAIPDLTYCEGDFDFFSVDVTAGQTLRVDILFSNAEANLGLEVLDSSSNVVGTSNGTTDSESVTVPAATAGRYFVRVFGPFNASVAYELRVVITE